MAKVIDAAVNSKVTEEFFNVLVPRPDSQNDNWYAWNIENWGTKWDTAVDIPEQFDGKFTISFDTAWSPPIGFYAALEEMGYTVDAYYYEPGMGFAGHYTDGIDDYYEYSGMRPDEIADMLPEKLDEIFCISDSVAEWEQENESDQDDFNTEEE